jgi:hypothetical protein
MGSQSVETPSRLTDPILSPKNDHFQGRVRWISRSKGWAGIWWDLWPFEHRNASSRPQGLRRADKDSCCHAPQRAMEFARFHTGTRKVVQESCSFSNDGTEGLGSCAMIHFYTLLSPSFTTERLRINTISPSIILIDLIKATCDNHNTDRNWCANEAGNIHRSILEFNPRIVRSRRRLSRYPTEATDWGYRLRPPIEATDRGSKKNHK